MHRYGRVARILRPSQCTAPVYGRTALFQSSLPRSAGKGTARIDSCRMYAATPDSTVTKIEKIILDTIKATGPISFATYMQMCLSHPTEGYYMNPSNAVFGARGDFITSPEISQAFGELLAVWLLSQWTHAGKARKIRLVELGPGRGTLMHDVLRVLSQFPAVGKAVEEVCLVETSSAMRARQEEKLAGFVDKYGWKMTWHGSIDAIHPTPEKFTMILAHEFFDALPFHLLQKTEQGWQEVLITSPPDPTRGTVLNPCDLTTPLHPTANASPSPCSQKTRLYPALSRQSSFSSIFLGSSSPRFEHLPVGSLLEVSPAAYKIARRIGELVHEPSSDGSQRSSASAGSALIVDYGGAKAFGSSFRAFKDHKIVDVFSHPGKCDLTVNVDFAYLKEASADLALSLGPIPQADFLARMGLQARIEGLKKAAPSAERALEIEKAARRLIDPTGMGSQYQVMGVVGLRDMEPDLPEKWPFVDDQA